MGTKDYIPHSHASFYIWQNGFYNRLEEKIESLGIDPERMTALTIAKNLYDTAFQRAGNPDVATRADRTERNERETEYQTAIRDFINVNIRYNSRVSDADRQYLGLNIADRKATPVSIPTSHPIIEVDFSQTRVHTLTIRDDASKRSKPAGIRNTEIWAKVGGEAPVDDSEMTLVGTPSSSTLRLTYSISQIGLRVYYQARWVNTRSQAGEFGSIVSAIIA